MARNSSSGRIDWSLSAIFSAWTQFKVMELLLVHRSEKAISAQFWPFSESGKEDVVRELSISAEPLL